MAFFLPGLAILLGSLFFATDTVFRESALSGLDSETVSFFEYGVALLVLLPFGLRNRGAGLKGIDRADLLRLLWIGAGGSALASVLFSMGIERIGGAGATLVVMAQPAFVLILARELLKERYSQLFVPCALWVIANMALLGASEFMRSGVPIWEENPHALEGALLALLATLVWSGSTVAGKSLLERHSSKNILLWRWVVATLSMGLILIFQGKTLPWEKVLTWKTGGALLGLGVLSQSLAYFVYYYGLKRLPASLATFIEILYPLAGIVMVLSARGESLSGLQVFAIATLVLALALLIGVEYPRAVRGAMGKTPKS